MKDKKNISKKPNSTFGIIVAILILVVARNIDLTEVGNLSFSIKTLAVILVLLAAIGAIGYIMKNKNNK